MPLIINYICGVHAEYVHTNFFPLQFATHDPDALKACVFTSEIMMLSELHPVNPALTSLNWFCNMDSTEQPLKSTSKVM